MPPNASLPARRAEEGHASVARPSPPEAFQLLSLPLDVLYLVFSFVPVDQLLRCREVSQGWKAFLDQPSPVWEEVDLSPESGLLTPLKAEFFRALALRTAGQLRSLDVSGWPVDYLEHFGLLLPVLAANSKSLRTLKLLDCSTWLCEGNIGSILAYAPGLESFHLDVCATAGNGQLPYVYRLMSGKHPFGPVRVHKVSFTYSAGEFNWEAFAEAAATHPSFVGLWMNGEMTVVQHLASVVDMALSLRMSYLSLDFYRNSLDASDCLPHITRLLDGGYLTELGIGDGCAFGGLQARPEGPGILAAFCKALRRAPLVSLKLKGIGGLWGPDMFNGMSLLSACTGHSTLRELLLHGDTAFAAAQSSAVVGEALAWLLSHPASLLESLSVHAPGGCSDDLGYPLFEAVGGHKRLQKLHYSAKLESYRTSFLRSGVVHAVAKEGSALRELYLDAGDLDELTGDELADLKEALRIVNGRAAAAGRWLPSAGVSK